MHKVKTFARFINKLIRKSSADSIMELSNGLTHRVLLAFFPFLVFLMTFLGYLELDDSNLLGRLYGVLPPDIYNLINRFITEVFHTRNKGLLSVSIFFTIFNASNGFRAVVRCLNKAYGLKENRHIVKRFGVSLLLMLTFALSIASMLVLLVFEGNLYKLLAEYLPENIETLYKLLSALVSLVVLTLGTMFIYKLACVRRLKLMDVFPGACVAVLLWVISSKGFSYFIANYSNYSVVYGSVAGVFILVLWLNLMSLMLLIGNEINSMLVVR